MVGMARSRTGRDERKSRAAGAACDVYALSARHRSRWERRRRRTVRIILVMAAVMGCGRVAVNAARAGPRGTVAPRLGRPRRQDRKSTRLNSSHLGISYAVFCLKKKKSTRYDPKPDRRTQD